MKKITVLILLLSVIGLNANVQKVVLKGNEIELSFENVKIGKIEFIKGKKLIVDCKKDEAVNIEKVAGKFIIFSEMEVKINLKLPENKTYLYTDKDAKIAFNAEKVTIIADDGTEVDFIDGELFVNSENENVQIGKNGIFVDGNDEIVEISSDGIFVKSDDDNVELTGFFGKLLGGFIGMVTSGAMNLVADNPAKFMKLIINEVDEDGICFSTNNENEEDVKMERFHEIFEANKGTKVNVKNINGRVEIVAWDKDHIDIAAIKKCYKIIDKQSELEKVKIEISDEDGCTIETIHLKKNPKVSVNYEIKIPRDFMVGKIESSNGAIVLRQVANGNLITSNGAIKIDDVNGDFTAKTSNGSIKANGVNGKISAHTSNGSIAIENADKIDDLQTSNGSIKADVFMIEDGTEICTSNGSIKLYFSSNFNAEITAKTSNSKVKLHDFEMSVSSLGKSHLEGKIGSGGEKLDIQTSNGSINFYKIAK